MCYLFMYAFIYLFYLFIYLIIFNSDIFAKLMLDVVK